VKVKQLKVKHLISDVTGLTGDGWRPLVAVVPHGGAGGGAVLAAGGRRRQRRRGEPGGARGGRRGRSHERFNGGMVGPCGLLLKHDRGSFYSENRAFIMNRAFIVNRAFIMNRAFILKTELLL